MHLAPSFLFFLLRPWFAFLGLGEHIDAESRIPSHLAVGEYATATWVIHKGDARGFARLHLNVPEHLEVTPLETNGASFDFDGTSVKLIWLDAPESSSFQIKLGIRAQQQFQGGAFEPLWSYIVDGQRQDVAMTASYLAAGNAGLAGSPLLPAPTEWEVEGEAPMEADALPAHYDPEGFHIERRAYIEGPDVARIEFHVSGHPKNRMLRIVEQLPEGCRAEHDVLEKATVRFESQELIFSWFNAPKAATFKVSYRILGDLEECLGALQGSAEFAVGESTVVAAIPDLASDQIQDPEGWLKGSPLEVVSAAPAAVTPPEPAAPEKPSAAVAVPAPDAGISFRVQVLAAHKHVNNAWFKQHFGYTKAVDIEPHADWIKYTTGSFAAYEDARNRREQLAQAYAFPGPFVTAYEHGERITVQEALVLAQQEWLP